MIYSIIKWLFLLPIAYTSTLIAWLLSPVLAMCVKTAYRLDTVKRFDKRVTGFDRYCLWDCLSWFQTHDNACDEYFWGVYGDSDKVSIAQYDNSILLRYWYRLAWLCRNPAYGFNHTVLGFATDAATVKTVTQLKQYEITTWQTSTGKKAFNVKGDLFITKHWYLSLNFGWKAHKNFSRLMYADRFIAPRKYE